MKTTKRIKQRINICIMLCVSATLMAAVPLGPDDAYTWSFSNDQLEIPTGSVITNAVLTIHNVSIDSATGDETLYVHLLDNSDVDVKSYADGQPGNYFEGYGVLLKQISQSDLLTNPSHIAINLTQVNDNNSPVWGVFEQPFVVTLGDASQVSFSSALLSLLDYAGTGSSFGFGLDCDGITFDGLSLELTIESMTDAVAASTLSFDYGTVSPEISEWTLLAYDDFESGWGNYTDGGSDCSLYTRTTYAPQGQNAASIRDDSEDASSFVLTDGIDVKTLGYSEIKITFSYIAVSMDNSKEGFRLDYWDGSEWLTLENWRQRLDFENNFIYSETVEISSSDTVFPTNMKIRFVCEASNDIDLAMIDEIAISAK